MTLLPRAMTASDIPTLIPSLNRLIGAGYFDQNSLARHLQMSQLNGLNASFVLEDPGKRVILGARISLAPGKWLDEFEQPTLQHLWQVSSDEVAYFKSLFLDPSIQARGWGPKLSDLSKEKLALMGAKAIVCHAWKESPNNSSIRYLEKYGFKQLGEHPGFWQNIDYLCSGCGNRPCLCTAVEMLLIL